jgi:adenylate cyclase
MDDDVAHFADLGVYDATAPHSEARLQALRLLVEHGATDEELAAWSGALGELAARLTLRPVGARTSLREMSDAIALPLDEVQRLWRTLGFAEPDPDDAAVPAMLTDTMRLLAAGSELLGQQTVFRLGRVIGTCLAQIADAVISAGFVQVVTPVAASDESGLSIIEANFALGDLIEPFTDATRLLLRMHLEQAMRPSSALDVERLRGYEERCLAVGFIDLTGSTRLAGSVTFEELGDAISEFEDIVADAIALGRARLVKLIGDEAMFAVEDPSAACRVALDVTERVTARASLPPVRAGVCLGGVLVRHGDCFGPVVNRAARLLDIAEPGSVLVDEAVVAAIADDARLRCTPLGARGLRGIEQPVAVFRVDATATA